MKHNPMLKKTILQVVNNQLNANNPPETRQTFERLLSEGYSEKESKELIACVLLSEMHDMLKAEEKFNHQRFVDALNRLPELPSD